MTIAFQQNGQEVTQLLCDNTGLITQVDAMHSTFIGAVVDTSRIKEGHPLYVTLQGETTARKMNLLIESISK